MNKLEDQHNLLSVNGQPMTVAEYNRKAQAEGKPLLPVYTFPKVPIQVLKLRSRKESLHYFDRELNRTMRKDKKTA